MKSPTESDTPPPPVPPSPGASRIPKPSFSTRKSGNAAKLESAIPKPGLDTSWSGGSVVPTARTNGGAENSMEPDTSSDKVLVTVRLRPISERERQRGDKEIWEALDEHTIGVKEGGSGAKVKFAFDTVFGGKATNKQVYTRSASRVVAAAMEGINATVFAYGVTSSGKTHTMMGCHDDLGIVQRAIRDVFKAIEQSPERDFLLRFSMMEIYNEVLNDLLDPSRANLKLREDPAKGFFVENLKEETLVSVDHALSVIAAGEAHRKVSATVFNEGSSRSHTIMRLSVESSERPGPDADPRIHVARTLSFLNLIDLAGSESARASLTKGHAREGSYINKSLLTLGTVIGKLSDGNAVHIPFRDSKLTRLLQSSMTGSAARISVIATATPASCQAEETHNTLKFATRAKKIEIHAKRNEILDQSSLIMRYQAEIAALRQQLEEAAQGKGVVVKSGVDPLNPEVRNLRERLEEEHQALLQREGDKAALEVRIARLTRIILHSTRIAKPSQAYGLRYRHLLLRESQAGGSSGVAPRKPHIPTPSVHTSAASERSSDAEGAAERSPQKTTQGSLPFHLPDGDVATFDAASLLTPARDGQAEVPPWDRTPDVAGTVASIRCAGDLFAGEGLLNQMHMRSEGESEDPDTELLREQVRVMADELDQREAALEALQNSDAAENYEVELQIMAAERDFLESKFKRSTGRQQELVGHIQVLRRQLLGAGLHPEVAAVRLQAPDDASVASDDTADASDLDAYRTPDETSPEKPEVKARPPEATSPARGGLDADGPLATARQEEAGRLQAQIEGLEKQVEVAAAQAAQRESELKSERAKVQRITEREHRKEAQLREVSKEALQLRNETARLEGLNNNLQGYGLDDMTHTQLNGLVDQLNQAIGRVRDSLQMRQYRQPAQPLHQPAPASFEASPRSHAVASLELSPRQPTAQLDVSPRPPLVQIPEQSPRQMPPRQSVPTKEFAAGDYAPMRSSMPSLARAVSGVATPSEPEEATRSQKYSFFRRSR